MKFGFVAKHRGVWPAEWLCGALGLTGGGQFWTPITPLRGSKLHAETHSITRMIGSSMLNAQLSAALSRGA